MKSSQNTKINVYADENPFLRDLGFEIEDIDVVAWDGYLEEHDSLKMTVLEHYLGKTNGEVDDEKAASFVMTELFHDLVSNDGFLLSEKGEAKPLTNYKDFKIKAEQDVLRVTNFSPYIEEQVNAFVLIYVPTNDRICEEHINVDSPLIGKDYKLTDDYSKEESPITIITNLLIRSTYPD